VASKQRGSSGLQLQPGGSTLGCFPAAQRGRNSRLRMAAKQPSRRTLHLPDPARRSRAPIPGVGDPPERACVRHNGGEVGERRPARPVVVVCPRNANPLRAHGSQRRRTCRRTEGEPASLTMAESGVAGPRGATMFPGEPPNWLRTTPHCFQPECWL
jgi:hypothetical protein